jgi:DUF4097 and DUF4098 domain-containing protein YvlB
MPAYDTPMPISVRLELGVGDIRVVAADRTDTVVEVVPSDSGRPGDVAAAAQTRVDFSNGHLTIKAPRNRLQNAFRNRGDSIDVSIELPAGSDLQCDAEVAALRGTGPLGDVRFRTGVGDISLDQAAQVRIRSGAGDVSIGRVTGQAEITTGSGSLSLEAAGGPAVVKNSNGDTWIGTVSGDLQANAANGSITVGHSAAVTSAKTANGDISLGEITGGSVSAQTAFGRIDVGLGGDVAAWLDLHTSFGHVQNDLPAAQPPAPGASAVEVRARTSYGDINVTRSAARSGK